MTINEKKQAIRAELAYQASDIVADIIKEHDGEKDYQRCLEHYSVFAADNISAWGDLTWDIDELEEELADTPYNMDADGNPCAEYDAIYQKLAEVREDAQEWSDIFDEMFEEFWEKLADDIYGEWE